jgi:hypothetical protein
MLMMVSFPDLVDLDQVDTGSGGNLTPPPVTSQEPGWADIAYQVEGVS